MKVIDPKSMLIGILITLLVFSTLGLRPKTDELGHLVVRSLTIEDDRGVIMGYLGNGYMQTYNQYGEPTLFIGTGKDGGGYMRAYNGNGDESAYVGTGRMGGGYIRPPFGQCQHMQTHLHCHYMLSYSLRHLFLFR